MATGEVAPGTGEVEPVDVRSIELGGTVRIRPLTIGAMRGREEVIAKDVEEWPERDQIEVLKRHVLEPDLSDLDAEELAEMDPASVRALLAAVMAGSLPLLRAREDRAMLEAVRSLAFASDGPIGRAVREVTRPFREEYGL